jgi:5'-3' exonuclease
LAFDSPKTWRKLYWPRYKESRKGKRDKSDMDWNMFHKELDLFIDDIERGLPFKVIKVENAEGDDVVAVLARATGTDTVVVSNDEDYLQLCCEHIKVYNPAKMAYSECLDVENFLQMKSLQGQSKDDIFNVLTPIDHPVGVRKPGFGEVSAKKAIAYGLDKWLNEKKLVERYNLNRNLIDFDRIPKTIKTRILNTYKSYQLADPANIYPFFRDNGFREHLENFERIETKLMQLY